VTSVPTRQVAKLEQLQSNLASTENTGMQKRFVVAPARAAGHLKTISLRRPGPFHLTKSRPARVSDFGVRGFSLLMFPGRLFLEATD
jgi:hypothetical protein